MIALRRYGLIGILAVAVVLAVGQVNQHLILASDNASYIVLGQSLVLGRGYTMINEPLAPPMNLYPFAYPALLAAVLRLTGAVHAPLQAVVPMKLVAVLFYLAALPVLYVLVRRRHGALTAALVTTLTALNPDVLTLATEILSDVPFLFLALLGLLLVETYVDGRVTQPQMNTDEHGVSANDQSVEVPRRPGSRPSLLVRVHPWFPMLTLLGAGLALAGAYYMRSAGLALLAGVPLYLLLRRRWWAGVGLAVFLAILALPWLLRSSAPPSPETPFFARSYIHQVLALAPYSEEKVSLLGLAGRIVSNSLAYGVDILPEALFPHIGRLGEWAKGGMALLLLAGFVLEVRRKLSAGEVAVAAYWLSLSLFVWVLGFRYVLIVIPFAFLYLLAGVQWVVHSLMTRFRAAGHGLVAPSPEPGRFSEHSSASGPAGTPQPAGLPSGGAGATAHRGSGGKAAPTSRLASASLIAVAAILAVSALVVDLRRVERNLSTLRRQSLAEVYAAHPEWSRWLEAVSWLQRSVPADAVIMARKPDLLYLLSGRPTVEYPYTKDTAVLMSTLRANGVTYVLEDGFAWTRTTATYLTPAMSGRPTAFTLVYESPAPRTRVWRVVEQGLAPPFPSLLLDPRPRVTPMMR